MTADDFADDRAAAPGDPGRPPHDSDGVAFLEWLQTPDADATEPRFDDDPVPRSVTDVVEPIIIAGIDPASPANVPVTPPNVPTPANGAVAPAGNGAVVAPGNAAVVARGNAARSGAAPTNGVAPASGATPSPGSARATRGDVPASSGNIPSMRSARARASDLETTRGAVAPPPTATISAAPTAAGQKPEMTEQAIAEADTVDLAKQAKAAAAAARGETWTTHEDVIAEVLETLAPTEDSSAARADASSTPQRHTNGSTSNVSTAQDAAVAVEHEDPRKTTPSTPWLSRVRASMPPQRTLVRAALAVIGLALVVFGVLAIFRPQTPELGGTAMVVTGAVLIVISLLDRFPRRVAAGGIEFDFSDDDASAVLETIASEAPDAYDGIAAVIRASAAPEAAAHVSTLIAEASAAKPASAPVSTLRGESAQLSEPHTESDVLAALAAQPGFRREVAIDVPSGARPPVVDAVFSIVDEEGRGDTDQRSVAVMIRSTWNPLIANAVETTLRRARRSPAVVATAVLVPATLVARAESDLDADISVAAWEDASELRDTVRVASEAQ